MFNSFYDKLRQVGVVWNPNPDLQTDVTMTQMNSKGNKVLEDL